MTQPNSPVLAATGVLAAYAVLARRNARQAGDYARAVIRAAELGLIPATAVVAYLREVIGASAATAAVLADYAVSADLTRRTGTVVPPLGLDLPAVYVGTIRLAVDTVTAGVDEWDDLDDDELEQVTKRVERLATNVSLDVGQEVQADALEQHGVELWTRGTDAEPCPLCKSLANGQVFPITKPMIKHPSCACQKVPVIDGKAQAGDVLSAIPADVQEGPQRTLSTGHGLGRYEYTRYSPGLTFSHHAPRVKDPDRFDPTKNGATEAAARANRGRKIVRTPSNIISLDDYRKKKNNGR